MAEAGNTCGLCGAPNPSDAIVCVRCGALLAAYRPAPEPVAVAETPVSADPPAERVIDSAPAASAVSDEPAALAMAPTAPGSAAESIFGETKLAPRQPLAKPVQAQPPAAQAPTPIAAASEPTPAELKARRLRRLADERIQALEAEAKQPRSTFQPTFQQLRRKSAPARQSLLDLVGRQPKEIGILSFVLFLVSMAMLGSGSLAAEIVGLFVLIAALIGGGAALLVASRNLLDRHDPR